MELLNEGKETEAKKHQQQCIDITHEMAYELIKKCREKNIDWIVAPYEADGQWAFLNKIGLADYIVTEDSDLILFGCGKVLFKLDLADNCDLVESDQLYKCLQGPMERFTNKHTCDGREGEDVPLDYYYNSR